MVELLVVMVLVAFLAGITGYTNLQTQQKKARDARRKTDLEEIRAALEMYRREKSRYPTTAEGLGVLDPDFIPDVPKDPKGGSSYYYNRPPLDNFSYDLCAHLEIIDSAPNNCDSASCGTNTCNLKRIQP